MITRQTVKPFTERKFRRKGVGLESFLDLFIIVNSLVVFSVKEARTCCEERAL